MAPALMVAAAADGAVLAAMRPPPVVEGYCNGKGEPLFNDSGPRRAGDVRPRAAREKGACVPCVLKALAAVMPALLIAFVLGVLWFVNPSLATLVVAVFGVEASL